MHPAMKLSAFTLGLAVLFGLTYGAGQLIGPEVSAPLDQSSGPGQHAEHGADDAAGVGLPGGLLVSDRGYTFTPVPASTGEFAFRIIGPQGKPVTGYDVQHDKRMHLIVVRRDLSGFRHLHPDLAPDGTWTVATPMDAPGSWRAFADFKPTGVAALTLGVDLAVPGEFIPRGLPGPARTASVDGYTVTLAGALGAGHSGGLTLSVSRHGVPVTDLQPYLGAYGHLVALRAGDLAYLHVHPSTGSARPGPDLHFLAEVPSAGRYRLYLDFRHGDAVHTAEFTVLAGQPAAAGEPPAEHGQPGHSHD